MTTTETFTTSTGPRPSGPVADAVSRVVAAFAAREGVTADDIVALTTRLVGVFQGLDSVPAQPQAPVAAVLPATAGAGTVTPALPIEKAVTDEQVFCLCCGRGFTMLKRHLKAEHGLTEEEYRKLFSLPEDMPLVAPNYSERKAAYAKRVGLGKYSRDHPAAADAPAG